MDSKVTPSQQAVINGYLHDEGFIKYLHHHYNTISVLIQYPTYSIFLEIGKRGKVFVKEFGQ